MVDRVERIKTGIPGFDNLVQGGFPQGFNILVTGAPGTGKTIFGLQYLYNGAMSGENGLYISLDSSDGTVRTQAKQFGWDITKLEKQGKLAILDIPQDKSKVNLFNLIEEGVREVNAKRLVFDSLAAFAINMDQFAIEVGSAEMITINGSDLKKADTNRKQLTGPKSFYSGTSEKRITFLVMNELLRLGTTNIVITDEAPTNGQLTVDGVSEYVCDGVIRVDVSRIAKEAVRSMTIHKMRNTNHTLNSQMFNISDRGLVMQQKSVFKGSKVSGISPEEQ
jgi:KaiC/GvpD/RAD55 family RecA-like ATPase